MTLSFYIIAGPTAIGKSEFAINLAKKINGNIINADSMQVYKDLEILTARPSNQDTKIIDHHLYGYVRANERYNVEKWCNDARDKIIESQKNNVVPILVGGTGLYIDKLINGISDIPQIPEYLKLDSENLIKKKGLNYLCSLIKEFDSISLSKINPNDSIRLKRIWEVYTHTGKALSEWNESEPKLFLKDIKYKLILFLPDRIKNYKKVNMRFISMLEKGAIDEVKNLLNLNLNISLPIMRAHGVPEITQLLEKKIDEESCIEKGQQVTRNYVKRQHTWWKASKLQIFKQFSQFPEEIDINAIKFI